MKTPYDVLGISLDADEKTIAIAFREAAKRCHPDLNPGDHAAERFKQLSAARDALSNPAQKPLIPDPPMGAAAVSAEVDGDRHQFELVGTRANVARRENDEPTQSVAIPKFQAGNEVANSGQESGRLEFPVVNMAQPVPTQDLATLEEDVQERERAPPASKQQRLNSCCERLENRSERVLKVRGPSAHYGAATRQSSGRNHNRRKSHVVRKQMHAAR